MNRLSWDEYFLTIVEVVGKRGTCDRGRSGCVIVRDKQILSTGYVGSPKGFPHCDQEGHDIREVKDPVSGIVTIHCFRTIHAEQNAICQAACLGISINGSTVYSTMTPCRVCGMLMINCGVQRVVCRQRYHSGQITEEMFKKAGIELIHMDDSIVEYPSQEKVD